MTTELVPTGLNPQAIPRIIRERYPSADLVENPRRTVLLARSETHWPGGKARPRIDLMDAARASLRV